MRGKTTKKLRQIFMNNYMTFKEQNPEVKLVEMGPAWRRFKDAFKDKNTPWKDKNIGNLSLSH